MALPHDTVGWSKVCDCGISLPYSLAFFEVEEAWVAEICYLRHIIYFCFHYFYVLLFSSVHCLIIFVGIKDNVHCYMTGENPVS